MFVEETYKDTSKKLEVKLTRNDETLLTSWQISDFISQLSKYYYKNELINTISLALKHGVSPKEIIIFEESFGINNSYSNINGALDFTNVTDVKTFYHLGEPISMFPNPKIKLINLIFKYFRRMNEILGRYRFPRLNKNNLQYYYTMIRDNLPPQDIIKEIENLANEIVKETASKNGDIQSFKDRVDRLNKVTLERFSELERDSDTLDILISSLVANDFDIFQDSKYQQLERKYFNEFFTKFENLKRPIIGIFNVDTQTVQIFCEGFMNNNKHEPSRFLDLKSISHNSPYVAIFTIGVPIVVSVISVLNFALINRSLNKEMDSSLQELEEAEERVSDTIRRLESLTEIEEVKAVEEIPQEYVRRNIKEIREQNGWRFQEPIERYGFINAKIEVNVVDRN